MQISRNKYEIFIISIYYLLYIIILLLLIKILKIGFHDNLEKNYGKLKLFFKIKKNSLQAVKFVSNVWF